jgi:TonB family protein
MKYILPLAIVFICSAPLLGAPNTPDRQEAIQRIAQAVSKTNIFELPSFLMKADVHIDNNGKPLDGHYQLLWNGPDQWREQITFPDYDEVQIGGKGTVWISRTTNFLPFAISNLHAALGVGFIAPNSDGLASYVQMRITPQDTLKKAHSRRANGDSLDCLEFVTEVGSRREVCLNEASGTLVRQDPNEDGNFQAVGGKLFPRLLSYKLEHKVVAKVSITELVTPALFTPSSFDPPPSTPAQPGCMNPTPARIVKNIDPKYPEAAARNRVQGTVGVDVYIGTDGVPTINKVVRRADSSLEEAALTAIRNWRFDPAMCGDKPVRVETDLSVDFSIRP